MILLLDDLVLDEVSYGTAVIGVSYELSTNHYDDLGNDDIRNWCPAVSTYGPGDLGTPGSINDCSL